jgi:hypothetical protein
MWVDLRQRSAGHKGIDLRQRGAGQEGLISDGVVRGREETMLVLIYPLLIFLPSWPIYVMG